MLERTGLGQKQKAGKDGGILFTVLTRCPNKPHLYDIVLPLELSVETLKVNV